LELLKKVTSYVYQKHPTNPVMKTRVRMVCVSIPIMTLMQAEKSSQNGLDYACICGDINLNITDKPENNNFI